MKESLRRVFGDDMREALSGQGGTGRLSQVLSLRGGHAAPEAPFVIEHRKGRWVLQSDSRGRYERDGAARPNR